jgi:hypothetical protein
MADEQEVAAQVGRWIGGGRQCGIHESVLMPRGAYAMEFTIGDLAEPAERVTARFQVCRRCGSLFCVEFNGESIADFRIDKTREE